MKTIIIVLLGMSFVFGIVALGSASSNIVGKWELVEILDQGRTFAYTRKNFSINNPFMEFFDEDKTFTGAESESMGEGKWVVLNDGRIKLTSSGRGIFFGEMQGDKLIITLEPVFKLIYKKAR